MRQPAVWGPCHPPPGAAGGVPAGAGAAASGDLRAVGAREL